MKLSIAALSLVAGIVACGDGRATDTAKQEDFKRDLQLASSSTMDLAGPKVDPALLASLETKPQGAPEASLTVKKGAGNRAVRSNSPTVRATPETDVAALDESSEEVETVTTAPVPEPSNEPVAVAPRPTPVVIQSGGGAGDYGNSGNGGGVFGGGGGIGGVVIRGGGVDGDRCEIHNGRGGRTRGGPIYIPIGGGIGTSRIPPRTTFPQTTSRPRPVYSRPRR